MHPRLLDRRPLLADLHERECVPVAEHSRTGDVGRQPALRCTTDAMQRAASGHVPRCYAFTLPCSSTVASHPASPE